MKNKTEMHVTKRWFSIILVVCSIFVFYDDWNFSVARSHDEMEAYSLLDMKGNETNETLSEKEILVHSELKNTIAHVFNLISPKKQNENLTNKKCTKSLLVSLVVLEEKQRKSQGSSKLKQKEVCKGVQVLEDVVLTSSSCAQKATHIYARSFMKHEDPSKKKYIMPVRSVTKIFPDSNIMLYNDNNIVASEYLRQKEESTLLSFVYFVKPEMIDNYTLEIDGQINPLQRKIKESNYTRLLGNESSSKVRIFLDLDAIEIRDSGVLLYKDESIGIEYRVNCGECLSTLPTRLSVFHDINTETMKADFHQTTKNYLSSSTNDILRISISQDFSQDFVWDKNETTSMFSHLHNQYGENWWIPKQNYSIIRDHWYDFIQESYDFTSNCSCTIFKAMGNPGILEAIDSKHRLESCHKFYYSQWKNEVPFSGISYFNWLDYSSGQNVNLTDCPRDELEQYNIHFFTKEERMRSQVRIEISSDNKGNQIVLLRNTTDERLIKPAVYLFVWGVDGEFYIHKEIRNVVKHVSFFSGFPVLMAGIFKVKEGRGVLREISPSSGHYKPKVAQVNQLYRFLLQIGMRPGTVDFHHGESFTEEEWMSVFDVESPLLCDVEEAHQLSIFNLLMIFLLLSLSSLLCCVFSIRYVDRVQIK